MSIPISTSSCQALCLLQNRITATKKTILVWADYPTIHSVYGYMPRGKARAHDHQIGSQAPYPIAPQK